MGDKGGDRYWKISLSIKGFRSTELPHFHFVFHLQHKALVKAVRLGQNLGVLVFDSCFLFFLFV